MEVVKRKSWTNPDSPQNALVWPSKVGPPSLSKCSHMVTRIHLCQGSSIHCLLVAGVLFTKMRGREANVRRFNRIPNQ
ncbi:unnamed protein product [Schistosoma margrebowiei]|uniref:Uncharacterized protein n=1 Tax=Schistosoma margrebowiei TaxID=48269 RepID=A0A3P7WUX5_9TREM|nr:unnamed protein product [Schistosoma margrebowiei]